MYLYKHFKFIELNTHTVHNILVNILDLVLDDFLSFKITNEILSENGDNKASVNSVDSRINMLFKLYSRKISFDNDVFENTKSLLLSLFDESNTPAKDYVIIRNSYIEELIMIWKNFPNPYSKVYFEPECRYRNRKFFYNHSYSDIKIDVIHANKSESTLQIYECKTTMKMFKIGLQQKGDNKHRRKLNYMLAFDDVCRNSDIINSEIAFATLAKNTEFTETDKINLAPLYLITRDEIELNYKEITKNKKTPR